jgi:hypothetical protein
LFKSSRCLLEVQGVKIFPGLVWGHRTDMYALLCKKGLGHYPTSEYELLSNFMHSMIP